MLKLFLIWKHDGCFIPQLGQLLQSRNTPDLIPEDENDSDFIKRAFAKQSFILHILNHLCWMYFPIFINWTSPFPIVWVLGGIFFIVIQILKGTSVSKQWRTWSDAMFCDVWSGFLHF